MSKPLLFFLPLNQIHNIYYKHKCIQKILNTYIVVLGNCINILQLTSTQDSYVLSYNYMKNNTIICIKTTFLKKQ